MPLKYGLRMDTQGNDTDGEMITIGEEMVPDSHNLASKKLTKNKTSRSPLRSTKNQTSQNRNQSKGRYGQLSKYD